MTLNPDVLVSIVTHARNAAPHECCGLLLGRGHEILDALPARNVAADRTTRFLIDPEDHFAARRAAREGGLDVVGFYHSHPHSAGEPSERDRAEFSYPGHYYAIVSLQTRPAQVSLYRFDAGNFQRLSFVTVA